MEIGQFDRFTQILAATRSRRAVLVLVAGIAAHDALTGFSVEAKKKKKRKKKKKKYYRCLTYGNVNVSCRKGDICCDPYLSTGAGCAPTGFPVCCASTELAYEPDIVCCATNIEGDGGICDTTYPNCCQPSVGGCCEAGFPVCCSNARGEYCCRPGATCCETSESGCCVEEPAARLPGAAEGTRGAWLPVVRDGANKASYSRSR